jgi:hypothetical protein
MAEIRQEVKMQSTTTSTSIVAQQGLSQTSSLEDIKRQMAAHTSINFKLVREFHTICQETCEQVLERITALKSEPRTSSTSIVLLALSCQRFAQLMRSKNIPLTFTKKRKQVENHNQHNLPMIPMSRTWFFQLRHPVPAALLKGGKRAEQIITFISTLPLELLRDYTKEIEDEISQQLAQSSSYFSTTNVLTSPAISICDYGNNNNKNNNTNNTSNNNSNANNKAIPLLLPIDNKRHKTQHCLQHTTTTATQNTGNTIAMHATITSEPIDLSQRSPRTSHNSMVKLYLPAGSFIELPLSALPLLNGN